VGILLVPWYFYFLFFFALYKLNEYVNIIIYGITDDVLNNVQSLVRSDNDDLDDALYNALAESVKKFSDEERAAVEFIADNKFFWFCVLRAKKIWYNI